MLNSLQQKSAVVLVIEPAASIRQMLLDVIKEMGFQKVNAATSGKDAVHFLEVETADWIITPLMADGEVNALQILKIITMQPSLRNTKVSMLLDPTSETYCLTLAFELGLMSYHPKSYVRDNVLEEFEQLFNLLKIYQWNATLLSSEYLRNYLTQKKMATSRIALEENLLTMFPGNSRILYYLAEAEFLNGQPEKAVTLLNQIELIDAKMSEHCKRLLKKYLDESNLETFAASPLSGPILGIKSAILIDPDTDILYHGSEILKAVGVEKIEIFEDGQSAYEWISTSSKPPDVIIMEWKLPKISGAVLVQKIRSLGHLQTPIIVISSLVTKNDVHILREMGVDECLEKPFEQNDFYSIIIWALQQNRMPTEQKSYQLKIRRLLGAQKFSEAERLIYEFTTEERISESAKLEIEAEYLFAKERYKKARDLAIKAIKKGGDNLLMFNLIGKAMLKLKQFDRALKCFEKANSISSLNIERLLNIAESSLYLENRKHAKATIQKAKELDSQNEEIKQTECKLNLEEGNIEAAQNLMSDLGSGQNIVSYMNNRAVSLSRNKRFDEAIKLYEKNIQALPPKWKEIKTAVSYNLSLAYSRFGDLEKAKSSLESIKYFKDESIEKKVKSLHKRLVHCIETGSRLNLVDSDKPDNAFSDAEGSIEQNFHVDEKDDLHISEVFANLEARRGDICCYLIFHSLDKIDPKSTQMVNPLPSFKKRNVIEK